MHRPSKLWLLLATVLVAGPAVAQQLPAAPPQAAQANAQPAPVAGPPALPQAVVPPPLPVAPPAVFFIEQNGQPVGPLSVAELQTRAQQGAVRGETLVWKQGTPTWMAAKDVPELRAALAAIPPPVPVAEQYKRLIVGTWQVQTTDHYGLMTNTTLTYNPDGTYSGVVTQTYQGISVPQPTNGTWTVQPVSEGKFSLTVAPAGRNMGGPATAVLRVIDNNSLYNDTDRYQARRIH
jgi:hypothetical protein